MYLFQSKRGYGVLLIGFLILFSCQNKIKNEEYKTTTSETTKTPTTVTIKGYVSNKKHIGLTKQEKALLDKFVTDNPFPVDTVSKDLKDQLLQIQKYLLRVESLYSTNPKLYDSITSFTWKICHSYYILKQKQSIIDELKFDSISKTLWKNSGDNSENLRFLKALITQRNDTTLISIEKAISPVFKIKKDSIGVYNNNNWSEKATADSLLFEKTGFYKIKRPSFWSGNGNFIYKNIIDSIYTTPPKLFLYSSSSKYISAVQSFGRYIDECLEYYYFDLAVHENMKYEKEFLIASPFEIQLNFVENPKIDSLLRRTQTLVCADCINSSGYLKTFATLDGINNIYFAYAVEPNKEFDETDTPIRAVYFIKDDFVYNLWFEDIDLFGCMCL